MSRTRILPIPMGSGEGPDPSNFYTKDQVDNLLAAQDEVNELKDVDVDDPQDGEALVWDATNEKWVNGEVSGGGNVIELTQAQYDALANPDPDTTYIITDADAIDMDDYARQADMETVQTAVAGKADKQNVTAKTSGMAFPHWNEQGVITGKDSHSVYQKSYNINGQTNSVYGPANTSIGPIYGPDSRGTAGQVVVSNGSDANPSFANFETLTGGLKFWLGTQAQYDALAPNYDSSTLYVISD